jgi:hypothetical protein
MEPTALTAQQRAVQNVRARYERGELSLEAFRRALDALVLARDPDECQVILGALPASPAVPMAALERPSPPAAPDTSRNSRPQWIVAFMGETKKVRRPWRLAPSAQTVAFMGEVKLDLTMATLPPQSTLRVVVIMGSVTLYVPSNVRVRVRSAVLLGEAEALGESASGVVAFGHEAHLPVAEPDAAIAELKVEAFILMGSLKVALRDGSAASLGKVMREAWQSVADGVRRGLQQGAGGRAALSPGGDGPAEVP